MFNVGKVGSTITLLGTLIAGCGDSAERMAVQAAARNADEVGLRRAASGLLHRCHQGKNLAIKNDVNAFVKCVDEGTQAAYPASCSQYYDTLGHRSPIGIRHTSECETRYQTFVTTGKDHFIRAAQSE